MSIDIICLLKAIGYAILGLTAFIAVTVTAAALINHWIDGWCLPEWCPEWVWRWSGPVIVSSIVLILFSGLVWSICSTICP